MLPYVIYDKSEKEMLLICSILDMYCVKYQRKQTEKRGIFGCESTWNIEIYADRLKEITLKDGTKTTPLNFILDKIKLLDKIEEGANASNNYNKDLQEELETRMGRIIDNKTGLDKIKESSFLNAINDYVKEHKSDLNAKNPAIDGFKEGIAESFKEQLKEKLMEPLKPELMEQYTDAVKDLFKRFEEFSMSKEKYFDVALSYNELPEDVKQVLLLRDTEEELRKDKFVLRKIENGLSITRIGDS